MASEPIIHSVFEPKTATWQYVVADPATKSAAIIDSVLDFEPVKNVVTTETADALLALVRREGYVVKLVLETHAHADHLTASKYLQARLAESQGEAGGRPAVCIGKRIGEVQARIAAAYGIPADECEGAFDRLLDDDEVIEIGELKGVVMHLPGHTPDHVGYQIGSNVFCGDSLFNYDVGSARCDFPGGSATDLFASVRRLLALPPHYRIWTGHDYPPGPGSDGTGRADPLAATTVAEQREKNKHLREGVAEAEFVAWRAGRDATLGEPRLLHQALQVNARAGALPRADGGGLRLLRVPVTVRAAGL